MLTLKNLEEILKLMRKYAKIIIGKPASGTYLFYILKKIC